MIADAHCHFFSAGFFRALARTPVPGGPLVGPDEDPAVALPARLQWDAPGDDAALARQWVSALDQHGVDRALLIASVPGDEASVSRAVAAHPERLAGAFMIDPSAADAESRAAEALGPGGLSVLCLFPAMSKVPVDDPRTIRLFEVARRLGRAVFVHCGLLSVGVRARLGLPSPFDPRLGDPLAVAAVAVRYPDVPVIIPHFGAGLFREALMCARTAGNVLLDTSSSNGWTRLYPGLQLRDVFATALEVVGPARLLFGTDSSFFPRGWQRAIYEEQRAIVTDLGVDAEDQARIFGGTLASLLSRTRPA